jgi:hypothetical protein
MKARRENQREIWRDGFAYAQVLSDASGVCPYPRGSAQADTWLDGWYQGALMREGLSYRDGPVTRPGTNLISKRKSAHAAPGRPPQSPTPGSRKQ